VWLRIYDDVLRQRWHVRHLRGLGPDDLIGDQSGRTFIVTGPTRRELRARDRPRVSRRLSGIGTEVAASLCRKGAHGASASSAPVSLRSRHPVVLACRSVARGEELAARLRAAAAAAGRSASVEVQPLDVASLASVRAFAAAWAARPQRALAGLVNNAGIFSMGTRAAERDADGVEAHWATNFLGPTLLALLLLPHLSQVEGARVVNVSSSLHLLGALRLDDPSFASRPYSPTAAYGASKLAALAFLAELGRRRAARPAAASVRLLSVHPGNVVTGVVRTLPRAVQATYRLVMSSLLLSLSEGARSTVFCAASPQAAPAPGQYYESGCALRPHAPAADDAAQCAALWEYTLAALGVSEAEALA